MSQNFTLYRRLCLLGTHLFTFLHGQQVGTDTFGNRYYESRKAPKGKFGAKKTRWVVYAGVPEASNVPPEWHGWLHYTFDAPLTDGTYHQKWQKPHQPNLTATDAAYFPAGSQVMGGKRAAATGDYEAWKPN